MNVETLYIDASDEITSVIERLKNSQQPIVALVVPKGSIILQSIVNLKLARKAALDAQKDLILVTTDKIGRNLAVQLGIPVANNEKEIAEAASGNTSAGEESSIVNGVRIHRYYADETDEAAPTTTDSTQAPLVPRELLSSDEQPTPAATPVGKQEALGETSMTRRSIPTETVSEPTPQVESAANPPTQQAPEPVRGIPIDSDSKQPKAPRSKLQKMLLIGIPIILVFGSLAAALAYYPKSAIILTVKAESWERELAFTANKAQSQTSPDSLTLPAEELSAESEGSVSFTATGTARVGTTATGTATIYNNQDTSPQSLPAGARLTANGQTFTTDAAVVVPGLQVKQGVPINGEAKVAITATAVGEESNLEGVGASITSPANSRLFAQITKTQGGTSRQVTVVSDSDIAKAREELSKKLREELSGKIQERLEGREVLSQDDADIFTLNSFTSSIPTGSEAQNAEVSSRASLSRLVTNMETVKVAIQERLKGLTPANQKQVIDPRVDVLNITTNRSEGTISFTTRTTGKNTPIFSTDTLAQSVAGKSEAEALQLLRDKTPSTSVRINQTPSWWPLNRLPLSTSAITTSIEYE